jgi:PAS domain S-box-containing protein
MPQTPIHDASHDQALAARPRWAALLERSVVESVPQAVVAVDRQGRVLCINHAAEAFVDAGGVAVRSRRYQEVLHPKLAAVLDEALAQGEERRPIERRIEMHAHDGRIHPASVTASPLVLGGGGGWVILIQDAGLDQEVRNLRQVDALKSEVFVGLLHDMKTPLTGIISGCDLLLAAAGGADTEQAELLKIIQASAERLQNLAGDIIEIASLQANDVDERMELSDLVPLVQSSVEPFILQTKRHRVDVECLEPSLPIYCQASRIQRVIENLLSNAIKYSPRGGDIRVRVRRQGPMAEISIEDHGLGIPADEIPRIWERFHRTRDARSSPIQGSGLGLSIIKMIVDQHRGRVQVESEHGKGSKFTVQLPTLAAAAGAPRTEP